MTAVRLEPNKQIVGFIGAGNMASAIAKGMVKSGHDPKRIVMSNPSSEKLSYLSQELGVSTTNDNQQVCHQSDVVLLTIKPQLFASVLTSLDFASVNCVISVAAGVTTSQIQDIIGAKAKLIRAMPNTPAMVLKGATGLFTDPLHQHTLAPIADYIFAAIGHYVWIKDEALMNSVTAIAGSAPAYFFQFVESLIAAGVAEGLSEESAKALVIQTALGASTMMASQKNTSVTELRHAVTSPGGTTAAALESLANDQFDAMISRAVKAAVVRGNELANNK